MTAWNISKPHGAKRCRLFERWHLLGSSILLLAGAALCPPSSAADELTGTVEWARRVELSTPLSGRIAKVQVQAGQRVKQGELLVELDPRTWQAQLTEAKAGLKRAQVDAEEAERELKRTQEMYDRTMLSEHERQLGEIAAERSRANLSEAKGKMVQAETELEYTRVTAPFDGLVVAVQAEPQQVVVNRFSATPLAVLADPAQMRVTVPVDADRAAQLKPGAKAEVEVRGAKYSGELERVGLEPLPGESPRLWPGVVRFAVPAEQTVRPGESAVVRMR